MAIPTATEVRAYLENYGITTAQVSDAWIEARRDSFIVPWIERKINQKLTAVEQVSEYYSGNGTSILILNARPIIALVEIVLVHGTDLYWKINPTSIEVITDQGMLKSKYYKEDTVMSAPIFPKGEKNVKVTYTRGFASLPADLKEAVTMLCAEKALGIIGNATGGGTLNVEGFSRNYGRRGKWTDARDELLFSSYSILRKYTSGVIGG